VRSATRRGSTRVAIEHGINASVAGSSRRSCERKSQFAQMITLSLLIAACFTLVSPQLAPAQHSALMELFDALGVWQPSQRRKARSKKIIFLFRLFSCIVPALCGDCSVLWQRSEMFWEQRDCCVRMEVCLCCGLMLSSTLQVLEQQSTDRHDSEHRGPAVVASATVSWNKRQRRLSALV
jgi:hypothetical protein